MYYLYRFDTQGIPYFQAYIDSFKGHSYKAEALQKMAWLCLINNDTNQYFSYIRNILHLDFGQSLSTQEPVLNIIFKSLPASLELGFFSILSATLIGIPLGLIGLRNRGKKTDYIARILGIATYAIPPFWGAMLAQLLFSVFFNP